MNETVELATVIGRVSDPAGFVIAIAAIVMPPLTIVAILLTHEVRPLLKFMAIVSLVATGLMVIRWVTMN